MTIEHLYKRINEILQFASDREVREIAELAELYAHEFLDKTLDKINNKKSVYPFDEYEGRCFEFPCELSALDDDSDMKHLEKENIRKSLVRNNRDYKKVSKEFGISERTLHRKMKEYGL